MKSLSVFLLGTPDRLLPISGWFAPLAAQDVAIQLWSRPEYLQDASFLAPQADVYAIDSRFLAGEPAFRWWPGEMRAAYSATADHVVIVSDRLDITVERLMLLFPAQRTTVWVRQDAEAQLEPGAENLNEFRAVVSDPARLSHRLGLTGDAYASPGLFGHEALENARACLTAANFPADKPFLIVNLGALMQEPAPSEIWATMLSRLISKMGGAGLLIIHAPNLDPAAFASTLTGQGLNSLVRPRTDLPLQLRLELAAASGGYIGVAGPEVYLSSVSGRPTVALVSGLSGSHDPSLRNVLWIGGYLPNSLETNNPLRFLPISTIAENLDAVFIERTVESGFVQGPPLPTEAMEYLAELIQARASERRRTEYAKAESAFSADLHLATLRRSGMA